jgi:hypothetical protein
MKHVLSAVAALALGIGLAASANAHGTVSRQSAMPRTDMHAGTSAPARHLAANRHQQSRKQVMRTQRMLRAHGLYKGRGHGMMNRQTQAALTPLHRQPKATHRVAAMQQHRTGMNRIATLHKARKPAGQEIGAGASRQMHRKQADRTTMSGSSSKVTPTPTTPPATQAPNAGGNDQKY